MFSDLSNTVGYLQSILGFFKKQVSTEAFILYHLKLKQPQKHYIFLTPSMVSTRIRKSCNRLLQLDLKF